MSEVAFAGPAAFNEAELLDIILSQPDNPGFNLFFVFELTGAPDLEAMARAVHWLGVRHEGSRTAYVRNASGWQRLVYAQPHMELEVHDFTGGPDPEAAARAHLHALAGFVFDLATPPLARLILLRLAPERCWFVFFVNHMVLDGVGAVHCLRQLALAYARFTRGETPSLPTPRQPREHAAALGPILAPVRAAPGPWCAPYPEGGFVLPADQMEPQAGPRWAGARAFFALPGLGQIGLSRSAPLVAAMVLALREIAGRPDVAFTLSRNGRPPASRAVVGYLVWGDSYFARIEDDDTFATVLARAEAFLADQAPWRMLYNATIAPPSRRVLLNINRFDLSFALPGLTTALRLDLLPEIAMWPVHDLFVQLYPLPDAVRGVVRYRTSHLSHATAERFGAAMARAVAAMLADPDARVGRLPQ